MKTGGFFVFSLAVISLVATGLYARDFSFVNLWIASADLKNDWRDCPIPFVSRTPTTIRRGARPPATPENPAFEFNGEPGPQFSCRQSGPYPWSPGGLLPDDQWFVQVVTNLKAPTCEPGFDCFQNVTRVCSPARRDNPIDPTVFGGPCYSLQQNEPTPPARGVGTKGCEICMLEQRRVLSAP